MARDTARKRENAMFEGLFQPMHLLVIFGIALLVFGPKRLPELGKGLGESIKGFKEALHGATSTEPSATSTPVEPKPPASNSGSGPTS
jgi:sec-independent protein translocase protein TatA